MNILDGYRRKIDDERSIECYPIESGGFLFIFNKGKKKKKLRLSDEGFSAIVDLWLKHQEQSADE